MIVRQGSSNERRLVRHAVRKFSLGHKLEGQREDVQVDVARFTTLLKEYGDHNDEPPKYTHQTVSVEPPLFKYSVTLKGVRGEGKGRTMKMAKHQASKDACQRLGLRVH
jgi:dsRNA-specific ribonuclease